MSWYAERVRRYEHMRFGQEPDRPRLPFAWGLEHIGGDADDPHPRDFLDRFVERTIADSDAWYAAPAASDYALKDNVLTFTSQIASPWPENNRVYGQLFRPQKESGAAVVLLAQWNARWEEQQALCRWLNRLGITVVKMSLPYHDRRAVPGHPRADYLVGPNLGLTLQAGRQSVVDARRTLRWLELQGYDRLGMVGASIGSCIGFITLCHEPRIRAGAFLHASTYFGDVVAHGLTTSHVWESIEPNISRDDLRRYWSPISPMPYLGKLRGREQRIFAIGGRYDPTFPQELTQQFFAAVREETPYFKGTWLPCGHYSLGVAPFSHIAGLRLGRFLSSALVKPPNEVAR
jgi:dienelactone hydrolase